MKGAGPDRDFGRRLPNFPFTSLLGQPGKRLAENPPIHSAGYGEYFSMGRHKFDLKTVYPGMLIGVGYMHPIAEKNDQDFQTGFYFDWTTGAPVIPGSSVKGALRAVFPKKGDGENVRESKAAYWSEFIAAETGKTIDAPGKFITALEKAIFVDPGDVFYDAYVFDAPAHGKVFAEDYITPHRSPFKDPVPLRFLKIGPGAGFRFQFDLTETKIEEPGLTITPETKLALFKKILLEFGVGAKRNTGYGVLVEC